MTTQCSQSTAGEQRSASHKLRLTTGPGAMRAITATICLLMIFERFKELGGLEAFTRLEAVSGSTIPLAFWAAGMNASNIQYLHANTHYLDNLEYTRRLHDVVGHHWWQLRRFKGMRPARGLISSSKFVAFVEEHVRKDPDTGKLFGLTGSAASLAVRTKAVNKNIKSSSPKRASSSGVAKVT